MRLRVIRIGLVSAFAMAVGAPAAAQQPIAYPARGRTPPQQQKDHVECELLQGRELGFGWTVALDAETGKISATLVDREGAIVLFGACTVP